MIFYTGETLEMCMREWKLRNTRIVVKRKKRKDAPEAREGKTEGNKRSWLFLYEILLVGIVECRSDAVH